MLNQNGYNDQLDASSMLLAGYGTVGAIGLGRFASKYEKEMLKHYDWYNTPRLQNKRGFWDAMSGDSKSSMPFAEELEWYSPFNRFRNASGFEQEYLNTVSRLNPYVETRKYANISRAERSAISTSSEFPKVIETAKYSPRERLYKMPMGYTFALLSMNMSMDESDSIGGAVSGLASEGLAMATSRIGYAVGSSLGGSLAAFGVSAIAGIMAYGAIEGVQHLAALGRSWTIPEMGGKFTDSRSAMTMRQRSLNAIRTSQFNVRSELGNEAFRLVVG